MKLSSKLFNIGVALVMSISTLAGLSAVASHQKEKQKVTAGKPMSITASAVSLNVENVSASSAFLVQHFGFHETMSDGKGGFASLERKDAGMNVIFLRRGNIILPENFRHQRAAGVILAFTVRGLRSEERRLRSEGVKITMPLREETWGERLFQVTDPSGIVIELVEWATPNQAK